MLLHLILFSFSRGWQLYFLTAHIFIVLFANSCLFTKLFTLNCLCWFFYCELFKKKIFTKLFTLNLHICGICLFGLTLCRSCTCTCRRNTRGVHDMLRIDTWYEVKSWEIWSSVHHIHLFQRQLSSELAQLIIIRKGCYITCFSRGTGGGVEEGSTLARGTRSCLPW
jgi:hypothetical protein